MENWCNPQIITYDHVFALKVAESLICALCLWLRWVRQSGFVCVTNVVADCVQIRVVHYDRQLANRSLPLFIWRTSERPLIFIRISDLL